MNRANHNRLNSPIITRVIELNKYLLQISERAKNIIKRNYLDAVLKKGATLFDYAMRQLKGLDYKNRYIRKIKNRRKKRNINSSIQKNYEIREINQ